IHAIDSIFNLKITPWVRDMRRVMYCGEWLQSHSLHIHMLAAPDFLGFNSVIEMAEDYPDEVKRGLQLQALGNDLIGLLGGRSVHPVGVCAGGFYKAPDMDRVQSLVQRLKSALPEAEALLRWTTSLDLPDDQQDFVSVAMRHENEYPLNEGRIVSDQGLDISIDEYEQHFRELHIPHSTALHSLLHDKPYLVGPLARINLNQDKLPESLRALIKECGLTFPSRNMFHSIHARAIEIYFGILEATRILEDYTLPNSSHIKPTVQSGVGFGCSEAPRGLLWHRYELDDNGLVKSARIVPPTSQNQARIEEDLRSSLQFLGLDNDEGVLRLHAEKVIRNYDPCISCATHFLDLKLQRQSNPSGRLVSNKYSEKSHCFNNPSPSNTKIIGVGSPSGSDTLGLEVIARLQQDKDLISKGYRDNNFSALDRPGMSLLEQFNGFDNIVLIDAVNSAGKPPPGKSGEILIFTPQELEEHCSLNISSHDLGVLEALALGDKLGKLPTIFIVGMNIKHIEKVHKSDVLLLTDYIKQLI
ncbi:MAG: hydrogenase maturation protease, partial [Kangiella sp.]|nr:hydrogenase maturation protease [Kangiella sp.]